MITIYIPTYAGNGPEAVECVLCARQTFPEARVVLADDYANPMPGRFMLACQEAGAEMVYTRWDRMRNLNGPDAVRGILSLLSFDVADEDIVIKVDPDTAIIGCSWLRPMLDNPDIPFTACGNAQQAAYGCCYALRGWVVREVAVIMQDAPLSPICPEDVTIGRYILDHYNGSKIFCPWTQEQWWGIFTAWRWQPTPEAYAKPSTYARRFDIVTTGNPCNSPFPSLARAAVMANLRRAAADLPRELRRY